MLLYLQSAFDNHIEEDKNTDVLENEHPVKQIIELAHDMM